MFEITNNTTTPTGEYPICDTAIIESAREHPEPFIAPLKCTGLGCTAMIEQKTAKNKVKLCKRCQNKVYRTR